jgi:hypothetical protein
VYSGHLFIASKRAAITSGHVTSRFIVLMYGHIACGFFFSHHTCEEERCSCSDVFHSCTLSVLYPTGRPNLRTTLYCQYLKFHDGVVVTGFHGPLRYASPCLVYSIGYPCVHAYITFMYSLVCLWRVLSPLRLMEPPTLVGIAFFPTLYVARLGIGVHDDLHITVGLYLAHYDVLLA